MDVAARLEAVELDNERLREQIARLEAAMGLGFIAPLEWNLTQAEARVMGALTTRDLLTKDAAMAVLYRDFGREEPEIKIVDVFICKIRKKVAPFGIRIETMWGQGYYLTAEHRAAVSKQAEAWAA